MAKAQSSEHGEWSSGLAFVLAATGSAVGLGNLWGFPYKAGENGGATFVLIYLLCIALVGLPVMVAEITLGRRGKRSPVNSIRSIAGDERQSSRWRFVGVVGIAAGVLILSFYSVVGGWTLYYIGQAVVGAFEGIGSDASSAIFADLKKNAAVIITCHTLFMLILYGIVVAGVRKGLQRAVTLLMPLLFAILILLVGYSMAATGAFGQALEFLFKFKTADLSGTVIFEAMGQAFFSLSLGMGAIMVYGAYLPKSESIPKTTGWIVGMDTLVALLAGLAIFPIVFSVGKEPASGFGLVFETLPIVFGKIPLGYFLGVTFFVLLSVAAVTSGISLLEPATSYFTERGGSRSLAAGGVAFVIWLAGLPSALTWNLLSDVHVVGERGIFGSVLLLANEVMLPVGGLLVAIFAGWFVRGSTLARELETHQGQWLFMTWLITLRFVAPLGIAMVLGFKLWGAFAG